MLYYGKGGWQHDDVDTMPVYWRRWYHGRLIKQLKEEDQARKAASKRRR